MAELNCKMKAQLRQPPSWHEGTGSRTNAWFLGQLFGEALNLLGQQPPQQGQRRIRPQSGSNRSGEIDPQMIISGEHRRSEGPSERAMSDRRRRRIVSF